MVFIFSLNTVLRKLLKLTNLQSPLINVYTVITFEIEDKLRVVFAKLSTKLSILSKRSLKIFMSGSSSSFSFDASVNLVALESFLLNFLLLFNKVFVL